MPRSWLLAVLSLIVLTASAALAGTDVVPRGKAATALVVVGVPGANVRVDGSAFCIDAAGFFVTNWHVVRGAGDNARITLVTNPGEANQHVFSATVVRSDREVDLAILKVSAPQDLSALVLDTGEEVEEAAPVLAFGYPFGEAMAEKGEYPSISVSTGHITSLRKVKGELRALQLDASLNPGNSGGPVLNSDGRVIGVVQAGIPGAALNFAIPVKRLAGFLEKPEITVTCASTLSPAALGREQEFSIQVVRFNKAPTPYDVELSLDGGTEGAPRRVTARLVGGVYKASIVPVPPRHGPRTIGLTATFTEGTLNARTPDRDLRVGSRTVKLSNVSQIEGGAQPAVVLVSGERLTGPVWGLESAEMNFGPVKAGVDLSKAASIQVVPDSGVPAGVAYTVSVRRDGALVGEVHGTIPVELAAGDSGGRAGPGGLGVGGSAGILPAPLSEDKVVLPLPGPVDDLVAGGGGRFLILHLKKVRQLAIFDANVAKIVKYLPLSFDDTLFTAGTDVLFVISADQNIVQRWSLRTLTREVAVPLPTGAIPLGGAVMGCGAVGPLLLLTGHGPQFYDPMSLAPLPIKIEGMAGDWGSGMRTALNVRASLDGSTFAAWATGQSPSGIRTLCIEGNTAHGAYAHESAGELLPSPDGSLLFTSTGIRTTNGLRPVDAESLRSVVCIPSYNDAYFLAVRVGNGIGPRRRGIPGTENLPAVSICTTADRRTLLTLPDMPEMKEPDNRMAFIRGIPTMPIEKRYHLIPAAKLLVTVPSSSDALVLRRVDLIDALNKSGTDYLFVSSTPLRHATRGRHYSYAIEVNSKRGQVQFSLDSGPEGMTISPQGRLSWFVPGSGDAEASVVVSIKDASGQELFHSFTILVR